MHDADDWISKMVERIEELMIEQIIAVSHIHDFFQIFNSNQVMC